MTVTTQTLSKQMGINDIEIDSRKSIVRFTSYDVKTLVFNKKFIDSCIDDVVGNFYSKQIEIDEVSDLIGDADTLARLKESQKTYVL